MYGLPQAVKISNDKLNIYLAKNFYEPEPITPVFWWHQTRPFQFSLVLDDFGLKYERQLNITHLLDAPKIIYKIYEDWYVKIYCGLSLELYYYKQ